MNPFHYTRVETMRAALEAGAGTRLTRYIAGGTNILDLMKDDVERPRVLVDINALPMSAIEQRGDALFVGALARMSVVAAHPLVRSALPMIASALDQSASPQLRNMASMGGNILQRTRCPYFRDLATPCNKREPGSGCGALHGVNRKQAVLGTSEHCIAAHASDVAVALMALDARIEVSAAHGQRTIPFDAFYRLPGSTPHLETTLQRGELITGLLLPLLPFAAHSVYVKVRDRSEYDFALTSAAVALDVQNATVRDVRIALGGVGTIPWRAPQAERALVGTSATRDSFARAADTALADARGQGQNDFKIALAKRTLIRALEQAAAA